MVCPLYGGRSYLGGSVMGGSTVCTSYSTSYLMSQYHFQITTMDVIISMVMVITVRNVC